MRDAVNNINALRQTMPGLAILAAHDTNAVNRLNAALTKEEHPA
jgi:hypothetical protein